MQLEGLVIPISFGMGGLLKGVDMITDLIQGAVSATFDWAEGMDKLGDVTGMTTEQTAAWAFVTKKAGIEVDTLSNAIVIMAKGLFDSKGELSTTGKALEDFGVSITDSSGAVKDQGILMDDIGAKYASFGTQTERVDFLTNVFGRSGANLIDVFDTLAQEGGIDAVTTKVKDLGLAVDPARYENFTRSLEELKLAGTGLAVQFTEMLMPAFEKMLKWAQQFEGMSIGEILSKLGEDVNLIDLSEKFKTWARSIDWQKVSDEISAGIEAIDWAKFGEDVRHFSANIWKGVSEAASEMDWSEIGMSLGGALDDTLAGMTGQGSTQNVIDTWVQNILTAFNISGQLSVIAIQNVTAFNNGMLSGFANLPAQISGWILLTLVPAIVEAMSGVKKAFFNAFQAAAQQAITALDGMKSSVMKAVQDFVDAVKRIIGKGIQMVISVSLPNFAALAEKIMAGMALIRKAMGGGGGGGSLGASVGGIGGLAGGPSTLAGLNSGLGGGKKGEASGGSAGGLTWVGESGPELVNLPQGSYVNNNQSSKRMANQPVQAYIDYDELARTMARVLGQQMQRA